MSQQRAAKAESLIQQVVATTLNELLEQDAASVTVTRVDAAPDLRNATVWIGLLGDEVGKARLWKRVEGTHGLLQHTLGKQMTTKFVPYLHLKLDTGGEYAAGIERLLRGLDS